MSTLVEDSEAILDVISLLKTSDDTCQVLCLFDSGELMMLKLPSDIPPEVSESSLTEEI